MNCLPTFKMITLFVHTFVSTGLVIYGRFQMHFYKRACPPVSLSRVSRDGRNLSLLAVAASVGRVSGLVSIQTRFLSCLIYVSTAPDTAYYSHSDDFNGYDLDVDYDWTPSHPPSLVPTNNNNNHAGSDVTIVDDEIVRSPTNCSNVPVSARVDCAPDGQFCF